MKLSATERAHGWAVFRCKEHGPLVATTAWSAVTCRCGKKALPHRGRRQVRPNEARGFAATLGVPLPRA